MKRRKTSDPLLISLQDQRAQTQAEFDRWLGRMFRAGNKCKKLQGKLRRLQRGIQRRQAALDAPPADQSRKEV